MITQARKKGDWLGTAKRPCLSPFFGELIGPGVKRPLLIELLPHVKKMGEILPVTETLSLERCLEIYDIESLNKNDLGIFCRSSSSESIARLREGVSLKC